MGAARVGDLESAGALPPFQNEEPAELVAVLSAIARAVVDIGTALREGSAEFAASEVGTANAFGDAQLSVDVASDKVVFDRLKGLCSVASSEETTREVPMEGVMHLATGRSFDVDECGCPSARLEVQGRRALFSISPGGFLASVVKLTRTRC